MNGAWNSKLFLALPPWALGRSQKVKYHVTFHHITLCVFSQMKDKKHIRRDFHSVAWVLPQGWDFGALGVPRGRGSIFFSNMVMWHIKSTGMRSRTECK